MADDIAPVAVEPEPVADLAPAVEAVQVAPETSATETPVEPASAIEGAAETEAPVEAAPETPAEAPAEETPPVEAVKAEGAEAAPAEAPLPTYEAFAIPEGLEAPPAELMGEFTGAIGRAGLSQAQGQELMDLHGKVMSQAVAQLEQHQRDVFDQTRARWVSDFAKENGNRRDTVLANAKWGVTQAFPKEDERARVWQALRDTGAGDHPAVIQAFARLGAKLRERSAPAQPVPPKSTVNKAERRYGRSSHQ